MGCNICLPRRFCFLFFGGGASMVVPSRWAKFYIFCISQKNTKTMAFCSRVGSILKQSISQSSASSMMNSIRCMSSMSSTKLFVGGICLILHCALRGVVDAGLKQYLIYWIFVFVPGLSFGTDDGSLKDAFSSFGEVVDGECHWWIVPGITLFPVEIDLSKFCCISQVHWVHCCDASQ